MRDSCSILFLSIFIIEFVSNKDSTFHVFSKRHHREFHHQAAPEIKGLDNTAVWVCYCDYICQMGEKMITPFINDRGDRSDLIASNQSEIQRGTEEDKTYWSRVSNLCTKGYNYMAYKAAEFGDNIKYSIAELSLKATPEVMKYYKDVVIHRKENKGLGFYCDRSHSGNCDCYLQKITKAIV